MITHSLGAKWGYLHKRQQKKLMFKGLFMKNLTSGSSVGHPWAGTKCLCGCTSHSVTCTVFDGSKVFPPKDKANPLKTVVEISSPGSKCCSTLPSHTEYFSQRRSHTSYCLSRLREGNTKIIRLSGKARCHFTLCCMGLAGPGWNAAAWTSKCKAQPSKPRGVLQVFQNWAKSRSQVKSLCRLKVRDFLIPGKMQRSKENQKSGSCTVCFEKSLLLLSLKGSSLLLAPSRTADLPVSEPEGLFMPVLHSFPSTWTHFQEIPNQAK